MPAQRTLDRRPARRQRAAPRVERRRSKALDELTPIVYDEFRRLARRYLRGERKDHSLQTTALVNKPICGWWITRAWVENRAIAGVAQVMRHILVDHARRRNIKRGRGIRRVSLEEATMIGGERPTDLAALDDALTVARRTRSRKAQVVEMRFFGGLSVEESAEVLGVSPVTVMRDWRTAKAWLYRELVGERR